MSNSRFLADYAAMINPEFAPEEWRVEKPGSLIGSGAGVCMLEDP